MALRQNKQNAKRDAVQVGQHQNSKDVYFGKTADVLHQVATRLFLSQMCITDARHKIKYPISTLPEHLHSTILFARQNYR